MLDKLSLNNQLLANKKKVRQAQINIINRLVKKIRKLEELVKKNPDDTKLKGKLDKSTKVLVAIKKVKSLDVLKKSLLNEKNPISVITNGKCSPEEIAEALLFAHKLVAQITRQLKESFHLNDKSNRGWRNELQELSKKKRKIQITEKKQTIAQKKEIFGKNKKESERIQHNNLPADSITDDDEGQDSAEGQDDEDEMPQKASKKGNFNTSSVIEERTDSEGGDGEGTDSEDGDGEGTDNEDENVGGTDSENEEKKGTNNEDEDRTCSEDDDAEGTDSEDEDEEGTENETEEQDSEDSNNVKPASKAVDQFFVTKTGKNYLSTAVINRVQAKPPNDGMVRKERRREQVFENRRKPGNNGNNRRQPNSNTSTLSKFKGEFKNKRLSASGLAKQQHEGRPQFKGKNVKFDNVGKMEGSGQTQDGKGSSVFQSRSGFSNYPKNDRNFNHKQKRGGFREFEERKRKFDNDGRFSYQRQQRGFPKFEGKRGNFDNGRFGYKRPQAGVPKFEGKREKSDNDDRFNSQRQQTGVPEFQGRGKFNNLNQTRSNSRFENPAAGEMHPSWEAKQKMKPVIKEFKGTKVVFNDD